MLMKEMTRYQQDIVEEKHFTLMSIDVFLLGDIGDLAESTVADQSSAWNRQLLYVAHTYTTANVHGDT